jgi:deferrochelatase/peroxidase EfeB
MKEDEASFLGRKISRRSALTLAGAFGAGMALGTGGALSARELVDADQTVEFYGEHQAGIATPQQDRLHFASFDLIISKAEEVRDLVRT